MGLILTVGRGDKITIGDDITATIQRFDSGRVKIHLDAPENVQINRIMLDKSEHVPKGQLLSPAKQRNIALNKLNRGNKNG